MYPRVSESTSASTRDASPLDYQYLDRLMRIVAMEDRTAFIRELRRAFNRDAARARQHLLEAMDRADVGALQQAAADLSWSSDALGATALKRVCEDATHMIIHDLQIAALNTIPRMEREIARVESELSRLKPG